MHRRRGRPHAAPSRLPLLEPRHLEQRERGRAARHHALPHRPGPAGPRGDRARAHPHPAPRPRRRLQRRRPRHRAQVPPLRGGLLHLHLHRTGGSHRGAPQGARDLRRAAEGRAPGRPLQRGRGRHPPAGQHDRRPPPVGSA
ncbi:MAG: hypothetical protein MZV63_14150 [Marinilabiliales bacterium]|nr:hypothetical protein [Marinilabiliales bacterium]